MIKKKNIPFISFIVFIAVLGLILGTLPRFPELEREVVEQLANRAAKEYFKNSLRIEKVSLDRRLGIHLSGITGRLETRQGPVSIAIHTIDSQDSLLSLLTDKPVRFTFEGIRPRLSPRPGISGSFLIQAGPTPRFELTSDLGKTDLEDWQWLDPQNLGGATGATKGTLVFRQLPGQEPAFSLALEAPEPGGSIQARFFDLFLPYLPTSVQKGQVEKAAKSRELVRYTRAAFKAELVRTNLMKILLQIFIPSYNLKLTLNVTLRTDEETAFAQIARVMGLIEVRS